MRFLLKGLGFLVAGVLFLAVIHFDSLPSSENITYVRPNTPTQATSTPAKTATATTSSKKTTIIKKTVAPKSQNTASNNEIYRVERPYETPPLSAEALNDQSRAALVNILCEASSGSLHPISGSGVLIDPRGVILTNAHVAQYVLLASDPRVGLNCYIRYGSPAQAKWKVVVLYMPSAWVQEHAADITKQRPMGTGEHDYALLQITSTLDGSSPPTLPHLSVDTREAIGFTGDGVLLASYPAEFAGGIAAQTNLYASSAFTDIGELFTFSVKDVDLISLGGVILAQGGSSGGAVVNAWGRLIALISTTSDGVSTADRDLRAITLSYIDRDMRSATGSSLSTYIAYNPIAKAAEFMANTAPNLAARIIEQLPH